MKRFLLATTVIFATIALIVQGFLSYDNPLIFRVADCYGTIVSQLARVEVIRPGIIRSGVLTSEDLIRLADGHWVGLSWRELKDYQFGSERIGVVAVTPDAKKYSQVVKDCIDKKVKIVIESSGMDAWHSTAEGLTGLETLTSEALRVVIFDGGHHLPTLGLMPDLLIVPVTFGYAAHGHTRDAMKIEGLLKILEREEIDCPVVAVPRWGLVKTSACMSWIAIRALVQLPIGKTASHYRGEPLRPRSTLYGQSLFLYVSLIQNQNLEWLLAIRHQIERVYVAFNFNDVNQDQVREFLKRLEKLGLQVELVNEPLHVAQIILQGGSRCTSVQRP